MPAAFRNELDFCSNFYLFPFTYKNRKFRCSENAFVWEKKPNHPNRNTVCMMYPSQAKKWGRKQDKYFDAKEWQSRRLTAMLEILKVKFSIPFLKEKLLATGTTKLVETNYWHDNFWGDCICKRCSSTPGQNHLGKLLMQVRFLLANNKL